MNGFFDKLIDGISAVNTRLSDILGSMVVCAILVLVGIYLTARTGFFQVSKLKLWWKNTTASMFKDKSVRDNKDEKSISQFQALATALSATIGTGNIVGVATAVYAGGPGAIFWMWVAAFFGMMTKFAEIALSMKYRYKNEKGEWIGGPMIYLEKGAKSKFLAVLYAAFCALASFGIGSSSQANSVATAICSAINVSSDSLGTVKLIIGFILIAVVGLVIIGGIKRIGKVSEIVVPFMAALYILGGIIVIIVNIKSIPGVFASIFAGAFRLKAAGAGILGFTIKEAIQLGVGRGIFSNEAGLGSSSIAHAATNTEQPVKQAMWGVFEVFADTIVVCSITGLSILTTAVNVTTDAKGVDLTSAAFGSVFGNGLASIFIAVSVTLFALSTMIGWAYYGERGFEYLFGTKLTILYKILFLGAVLIGTSTELDIVWKVADTFNSMLMIPNLIGLVILAGEVVKMVNDYTNDPANAIKKAHK